MVEWRISIYGRSPDEWSKLAAWVVDNGLFSPNVRWLIQVPRLFDVYKAAGLMETYEQVVMNVFRPLFEVTEDPTRDPKLHVFLQRVIGFDCVDDESKPERRLFRKFPKPKDWNTKQNPPVQLLDILSVCKHGILELLAQTKRLQYIRPETALRRSWRY